eukprot:2529289-Rhodomonas_salina.1
MKKHLSHYGTAKPERKGHPTKIQHDEEHQFINYIKLMQTIKQANRREMIKELMDFKSGKVHQQTDPPSRS